MIAVTVYTQLLFSVYKTLKKKLRFSKLLEKIKLISYYLSSLLNESTRLYTCFGCNNSPLLSIIPNYSIIFLKQKRMNWNTYKPLLTILLTLLISNTQSSASEQSTSLAHSSFLNNEVFRELEPISYTPFGNQVMVDIFDSHFTQNQIINLVIELKNNNLIQHTTIYHLDRTRVTIDVNYQQIKKIEITNARVEIENKPRIMQNIITESNFLTYVMYAFQLALPLCRNLIIIGLIFNILDTFLPFILLCQSFIMFGLFNADQHYLNTFFYNIFNSKLDLMNAIRLSISNGSDSYTLSPLAQYNFSSNLFVNIGGEFVVTVIFLGITVIISVFAVCCNSQRFRTTKTKLRPLWNGYFMGITPRLATFTGFHFRMIEGNEVNGFIASVLGVSFLAYFIQLLIQTKRINSKVQYIQESKSEIGLVSRIDYKKDFQFDCLHYSMLYYPLMNFVRLLIFFIPIGAAYDLYYVSFGGAIVSQLFMMMIQVSSPGYSNKRDKFFYPLNNFLLLNIELCIITVTLAQSVSHPQVSLIAETVLFSIAIFLFTNSFVGVLVDTFKQLKTRCCFQSEKIQEMEEQGGQKFVRKIGKLQSQLDDNVVRKTEKSDDSDGFHEDELQDHRNGFSKQNTYRNQVKIKKVRRGKII